MEELKIKNLFVREIGRDLDVVIKTGDRRRIDQELDEYVVTKELQKHFSEFFSNYCDSLDRTTAKMGVWISGFFGSGKSHFLKILSYLLSNEEVNGKNAVEYFRDKISDAMVMANIDRAASSSKDVILFNISEESKTGKKDSVLEIFLRLFNSIQGLSDVNYVADFERKLIKENKYENFVSAYNEISTKNWVERRNSFSLEQDNIVKSLVKIGFMSEDAARNLCKTAMTSYSISISDFAKLVKKYLDSRGKDHHIIFMADEVGQFIGDKVDLMLELQTIVECLGVECGGRAWVVVTSQQDVDSLTKVKGNDFSKIQGRFDTRIALTSVNADEVVRKRILAKRDNTKETLAAFYDSREMSIKNLLQFNDKAEKKLFVSDDQFVDVYPMIPYHFKLIGDVLTAVRTHSSSGKHLSEGERSLIKIANESGAILKNYEIGQIISFDLIYDCLEKWLDSMDSKVIYQAKENDYINPSHDDGCLAVRVLKVLFLIKYIKEIVPNIHNLACLLIRNVNDDRVQLEADIEKALNVLIEQTLVSAVIDGTRHEMTYHYLSDSEQTINREIKNTDVDSDEVTRRISELIFNEIFAQSKFYFPQFKKRYAFPFNTQVDEIVKDTGADVSMKVITSASDLWTDGSDTNIRTLSTMNGGNNIYVLLPDSRFREDMTNVRKIEKYFTANTARADIPEFEAIKAQKLSEAAALRSSAKELLTDALQKAVIYYNGNDLKDSGSDITSRFNKALENVMTMRYSKLGYITKPMGEADVRNLFKSSSVITMTDDSSVENKAAIDDVFAYIEKKTGGGASVTLKNVMDYFTKAPYGFVPDDVHYIVAYLMSKNRTENTFASETINIHTKSVDEIWKIIHTSATYDKLKIMPVEAPEPLWISNVRKLYKAMTGKTCGFDDTSELMASFRDAADDMYAELERLSYNYPAGDKFRYPGFNAVSDCMTELNKGKIYTGLYKFYQYFGETEYKTYNAHFEAVSPVRGFWGGKQKTIWDRTLDCIGRYETSADFITNPEIGSVAGEMRAVIKNSSPYNNIFKLNSMCDSFSELYDAEHDRQYEIVKKIIEEGQKQTLSYLMKLKSDAEALGIHAAEIISPYEEKYKKYFADKLYSTEHAHTIADMMTSPSAVEITVKKFMAETDSLRKEIIIVPVPPKPKKSVSVSLKSVSKSGAKLSNRAEIDAYVKDIEKQLIAQLESDSTCDITLVIED